MCLTMNKYAFSSFKVDAAILVQLLFINFDNSLFRLKEHSRVGLVVDDLDLQVVAIKQEAIGHPNLVLAIKWF